MTNERVLLNQILREDFYHFAQRAFEEINPGQVFTPGIHIEATCYFLTCVQKGTETRGIINMPPRHLKSFLISIAFPAWYLGHFPRKKIMCVSYSDDLARELSRARKKLMSSGWYQQAFPGTVIGASKNTENEFETTQRGGCLAVSMGGSITGRGCDVLIIDDPSKADDMRSEAERKRTKEIFDNTLSTRLNSKEKGTILLVMQRLNTDDLTAHLLKNGGYTHLCFPAIAEKKEKIKVGHKRYIWRYEGELLQPTRESLESLQQQQKTMTSYLYAAQYQQQPVPAEGNIFKKPDFKTYTELLPIDSFERIIISIDTATKTGVKNDYSALTVWGILKNEYYLINVVRKKLDYPALKAMAVALSRLYPRGTLLIEDAGIGTALTAELRAMLSRTTIAEFKTRGIGKIARAEQASDAVQGGRVFLPADAPWLAVFMKEVLAFPNGDRGEHDDQVDSMSQFLCWIGERKPRRSDLRIFTPPEMIGTRGW